MGKAGKALKQVLKTHRIAQNRLAISMGVGRSNVHRWIYEITDPVGDAVLEIRNGLYKINPTASEEFIKLYLEKTPEEPKH